MVLSGGISIISMLIPTMTALMMRMVVVVVVVRILILGLVTPGSVPGSFIGEGEEKKDTDSRNCIQNGWPMVTTSSVTELILLIQSPLTSTYF